MEKKKYKIFSEVLKRFYKAGILDQLIIAGSWNIFLYESYFMNKAGKIPPIRTIDVDFLVPSPAKIKSKEEIPEILKELGYVVHFKGNKGFIELMHPDLIIEFIVPEKGRGKGDKPVPLPGLGVNASALRFMDVLYENKLVISYEGLKLNIAHPAALAFHYLLIYPRRKNREKADKNFSHAAAILQLLIEMRKNKEIKTVFNKLHKNWKKEIVKLLNNKGLEEIASVL